MTPEQVIGKRSDQGNVLKHINVPIYSTAFSSYSRIWLTKFDGGPAKFHGGICGGLRGGLTEKEPGE